MNTLKHTPGPWKVESDNERFNTPSASLTDVVATVGRYCVTCKGVAVPDIAIADARLIAAAPELLEALIAVVADWDLTVGSGTAVQDSPCTRAMVRAAIAKATGEAP